MNKRSNKFSASRLTLLASTLATAYLPVALAGDLNLADNALEVANGIEPNVFLLTDNSGSMDWEVTIRNRDQGLFHMPDVDATSNNYRAYIFPNGVHWAGTSSQYGRIVPREEAVLTQLGTTSDPYGVWRVRYSGYNAQYYNPDVTYIPWKGVDSQATPAVFANSTPDSALYDAWLPAGDTEDLTQVLDDYTAQTPTSTTDNSPTDITVTNYFPARYYTWTDTDSDGVIDATDSHTRVEIKPAASGGSDSYTRAVLNETTGFGRSDCGQDTDLDGFVSCSYALEIQNFANWFTYYRKRDLATKAAISQALEATAFARVGMATINDTSNHRIGVASMNASTSTGNKKSLLDTLFNQSPTSGGTPLRDNLDKAGLYYTCDGTSGESDDIFGGSAGCPRLSTAAGSCQQNYTILMTDGFYNGSWSGSTDHDGDDDSDYDGGSFAATETATLADIAMKYYEDDLDGDSTNNLVPITTRDANYYRGTGSLSANDRLHQHMTTFTLAYGVEGTLSSMPSDLDAAFTWPTASANDAQKVDDLRHAAYNGRGQFMNAANPVALRTSLGEIFSEILDGTGVASAVAFNTQNLKSNSVVFRAFFDTTNNTGDMLAHPIGLNGVVDLTTSLWSAAEQLDGKTDYASDSRVIVTYKDNAGSSTGIPFQWANLTSTAGGQQDQLNAPALSNYTRTGPVGKDRLEYLRGQSQYEGGSLDDGEFRVRPTTKGKLGDLVHSAPVFVGSPPFTGRGSGAYPVTDPYNTFKSDNLGRDEVVYISGNDGMLHAFAADTGDEVFAYVPNMVFENLSDLTKPDYSHSFYVDLTPSINDVYITRNSALDWYTVLVGGLGKGGKGYYAIDITDPTSFDTETNAAANVMWEFTEDDDPDGDLGYSFSEPVLAMSNATDGSGNQRWVAIFGNGYNSSSAAGNAALYVLFIDGGEDGVWSASDFVKIDTGVGKATSSDTTTPNGLSGVRAVDTDLDGTVDHVYAGDLQGNLYRFDLSSSNTASWGSSTKLLFQATYGVGGAAQPITNEPVVIKHPEETGFIVIFGTGSWITDEDATSTDIQSIYGVWDDMSNTPLVTRLSTNAQLIEQSFEDKSALKEGNTVGSLSSNTVTYDNTGSASSKVMGWYIDLDVEDEGGTVQYPGERAVRDFLVRGGLLFVNTVLPKDPTSCGPVPGGFTLGFDPVSGSASSDAIFDLNGDGQFSLTDNIADVDSPDNVVSRIRHDSGTPSDSSFIDNILVTNVSTGTSNGGTTTGDVDSIKTNTGGGTGTGRFSWRELKP